MDVCKNGTGRKPARAAASSTQSISIRIVHMHFLYSPCGEAPCVECLAAFMSSQDRPFACLPYSVRDISSWSFWSSQVLWLPVSPIFIRPHIATMSEGKPRRPSPYTVGEGVQGQAGVLAGGVKSGLPCCFYGEARSGDEITLASRYGHLRPCR